MTKENFTSINVIIDRSGSMSGLTQDTIGSFNSFIKEQKDVPGEASFTLCTFNHDYSLVHDFVKLASVPDLNSKTYQPSGNTALLDALGTTITTVGQKLAAMPEDERPSKVIFLVITDGQENASQRFSKEQIKSMVEHQTQVYNWEFVFIGANIDAFHAGQSYGFAASKSVSYNATAGGTRQLYNSVSSNLRSYRLADAAQYAASGADFFGQTGVTPTSQPTPSTVDNTIPGTGPTDPADANGSNQ